MFKKGIENLCNAIVEQAAMDYREQYRDFILNPQKEKVAYLLLNRRYFENDCHGMTTVGLYIAERIEKEIRASLDEDIVAKADSVIADYKISYRTVA